MGTTPPNVSRYTALSPFQLEVLMLADGGIKRSELYKEFGVAKRRHVGNIIRMFRRSYKWLHLYKVDGEYYYRLTYWAYIGLVRIGHVSVAAEVVDVSKLLNNDKGELYVRVALEVSGVEGNLNGTTTYHIRHDLVEGVSLKSTVERQLRQRGITLTDGIRFAHGMHKKFQTVTEEALNAPE